MAERHDVVTHPFTVTLIRIKAKQLCRRTDMSRSDLDDLQQEMRLYLLQKLHLFDPERGNLEAFVTNVINTCVAMLLRHRERDKRRESYNAISLERTRVECDGDLTTLGAVLLEEDGRRLTQTAPISPSEQFELREALQHVVDSLSAEDRALLMQVAEHGITHTAKVLGVSWRQVNNAMARIRDLCKKAGLDPN